MTAVLLLVLFLAVVLALAGAAFCAGMETGFLSVRRERVLHLAREGSEHAKIVFEAISNMGRTTTALLVGNNLASVSYSSAATALIAAIAEDSLMAQVALSFASALLILFLGEFLPKLLCSARPLVRLLSLAPAWRVFAHVFAPVGAVVQWLVERLMPRREPKAKMTPEAILRILADRHEGVKLSAVERALVGRILMLRARGEFIVPDSLLPALDESML